MGCSHLSIAFLVRLLLRRDYYSKCLSCVPRSTSIATAGQNTTSPLGPPLGKWNGLLCVEFQFTRTYWQDVFMYSQQLTA